MPSSVSKSLLVSSPTSFPSSESIAYIYDGSLEGLLTVIFNSYAHKVEPSDIVRPHNLQARLGQSLIEVETDRALALRVQRGICRRCGPIIFEAVKSTSLSDDPEIGMIIYRFLKYSLAKNKAHDCSGCSKKMKCGGICVRTKKDSALNDIAHSAVAPFITVNRKVYNEREKMMQFLRFEHMEGDVWFARCNPNASVVPLIMDWFAGRFNTQAFMIYDEAHHLAGIYEGQDWYLVKTDQIKLPEQSDDEKLMQQAWKRFYKTIAVESRYNPELRKRFMPKRLWRNVLEMQEDFPRKGDEKAREFPDSGAHTPSTDTTQQQFKGRLQRPSQPQSSEAESTPVPSKEGIKLSLAASPSCQ